MDSGRDREGGGIRDRSVISRNVQNTKISDMHNLLSQGHDMDYIAKLTGSKFTGSHLDQSLRGHISISDYSFYDILFQGVILIGQMV